MIPFPLYPEVLQTQYVPFLRGVKFSLVPEAIMGEKSPYDILARMGPEKAEQFTYLREETYKCLNKIEAIARDTATNLWGVYSTAVEKLTPEIQESLLLATSGRGVEVDNMQFLTWHDAATTLTRRMSHTISGPLPSKREAANDKTSFRDDWHWEGRVVMWQNARWQKVWLVGGY